jgi:hypothetical protein
MGVAQRRGKPRERKHRQEGNMDTDYLTKMAYETIVQAVNLLT